MKNLLKTRSKSVCIPFRDVIDANRKTGIKNLTLQEMIDITQGESNNLMNGIIPISSILLVITSLVTLMNSSGKAVYAYQQASDFDLLLSPSIAAIKSVPVESMTNWSLWSFAIISGIVLLDKSSKKLGLYD